MHFTLGKNFGEMILGIAQEHILNLSFDKAISLYTESFPGMSEDYALQILRNEYVVIPKNDGTITLSNKESAIKANAKYMYNWNYHVTQALESTAQIRKPIVDLFNEMEFGQQFKGLSTEKFLRTDFDNLFVRNIDAASIAIKILQDEPFDNEYDKLYDRVTEDEQEDEVRLLECLNYLKNIRLLHKETLKAVQLYERLYEHKMIEHIPFVEDAIERSFYRLCQFIEHCKFNFLCNHVLDDCKRIMGTEINHTKFGAEYFAIGRNIRKNILDGYDAGWLSPEGDFYGANGDTGNLIHCTLAERLEGCIPLPVGTSLHGVEYQMEQNGWMKIHHREVYGMFKFNKEDKDHALYCPTEAQVNAIAAYIDKFYGGVFLNHPDILGGKEIKTSRLKQADEIQLREIFKVY